MSYNKQSSSKSGKPQLPGVHELFPHLFDDRTGQQQGQQIGGATSPDVQTKALAPGQSLQLGGYPPVPFNADPLNRGRAPSSRIIPPPPFHTQLSTPSQDHRFSSSNPVPGFSHSPAITLRPAEWTSPSSTLPAPLIDRKRYACELCGKRFERPSSRETHMHSHTGERPFKCIFDNCHKYFSTRSNMQRHVRTNHQGQA